MLISPIFSSRKDYKIDINKSYSKDLEIDKKLNHFISTYIRYKLYYIRNLFNFDFI